ncbi:fimbrial major subunit CsuA/B family protein [Duganella sp. FT109W]|uniref:Fimbrial major subunit CsuA/B family protein n=1 Tax=Duganella margarita TaxID=2692170 RepID=A0A7X4KGE6_9BURK|nr:spore coat protein U domain-containing protein [Duganella margarita]MYM72504.1 fimbrial major subunit CsuA/B family protein [Duganella margarita]MYN40679.1 fimbrial major subunit CsuA/B family protein [Duganella margarita]
MKSARRCLLGLGLLLMLCCGQARADGCTVAQTNIVFPSVSSITSADAYANANFKVTCTWTSFLGGLLFPNATVCLYLGDGSGNTSPTVTVPRQLANGTKRINYNLYTDTSYSAAKIWGGWAGTDTAANVIQFTLTKSDNVVGALTQDVNLYGKLNADATLAAMDVGPDNLSLVSNFSGSNVLMRYIFFLTGTGNCLLGTSVAMPFQVSANVINDCDINVGNLVFPNSSLLTSAIRTTSTLTARCSKNTAYRVTFSAGTTPGNTTSARKMIKTSASDVVSYQISNVLDGASLGDGSGGTVVMGGTGDGTTKSLTVFGLVPAQTTPSPGDYKDTVVATVWF